MDEEQGYQPRKLRTKSSDLDSQPIRTAYPATRHHSLGGDYAFEASTGEKSDSSSQNTPRTSAEVREQLLNTEIPRGPYTVEGCAKIQGKIQGKMQTIPRICFKTKMIGPRTRLNLSGHETLPSAEEQARQLWLGAPQVETTAA